MLFGCIRLEIGTFLVKFGISKKDYKFHERESLISKNIQRKGFMDLRGGHMLGLVVLIIIYMMF